MASEDQQSESQVQDTQEESQEFDFSALFDEDGVDTDEPLEGGSEEEAPSDAGTPDQQGASGEEGSEEPSTEQTSEQEASQEEEQAASDEEVQSSESEEQVGESEEQAVEEQPQERLSEEEYQRQWQETRDRVVEELASSEEFQVSEEEADQLLTEPQKVLPYLMARASTRIFQDTVRQLHSSIPSQVENTLRQREVNQQREERFVQKYPELKDNLNTVKRVARTVAQTGEFETQEQLERMVAVQSMLALGKSLPSRFYDGEGGSQPETGQQQAPEPQGRPSAESTPHRPAGAGQPDGPSSAQQGERRGGFWENLNAELDEEHEEI